MKFTLKTTSRPSVDDRERDFYKVLSYNLQMRDERKNVFMLHRSILPKIGLSFRRKYV